MAEKESKRLKRSFIQLAASLEDSSAMVLAVDPTGRVVYVNRAFQEAMGYKLGEIQGAYIYEVFLPDREAEFVKAMFQKLELKHMPYDYTGFFLPKEGEPIYITWSNQALFSKEGRLEGFVCTGIDITERKRVEEALRRSEEHFRTLIEGSMDVVAIMGADGIISFVSPSVEPVLGYRPEELVGANAFDFVHPEELPDFLEEMAHSLTSHGYTKFVVCRLRHKDGSYRSLEAIGRNLLDDPAVRGIVINGRDITERQLYDQELANRAERLRDFLAIAAHELRHPITVIKGYVSTLLNYQDTLPPDSMPTMLGHIDASVDRLSHIVSDLVDVSRIEKGHFPVEPSLAELDPLVEKAVEEIQARFAGHRFETRCCASPGPVPVDGDRFIQLLIILLENAVNFSPASNLIEIETERLRDEARVSVQDQGPGVPEEARTRIFERFFQLEDMRHHSKPGLGLGLYIAREIVEAHGGRIWHEPRPGGGSVFCFTLPVKGRARHLRSVSNA